MERDEVYVRHILDAIAAVASFLNGLDYGRFTEDLRTQSAVVRQIEIVGEATSRLSEDFRARHDDIPWRDIIGMRNKLVHEYFGVDLEAVWKTATEDLTQLKRQLTGPREGR